MNPKTNKTRLFGSDRIRVVKLPRVCMLGLIAVSSLATGIAQTSGTWAPTGSMTTPRYAFSAVQLNSGKVLVAGGMNATSVLSSAELYDPLTGTWSPTGKMKLARAYYTTALLRDGKVLVTGGCTSNVGCSTATATAEIYDPATGKWRAGGKMSTLRYYFNATSLPNGKVLVEGGCNKVNCGSVTKTAELFDPTTLRWTLTGSMRVARDYHTATALSNGQVMVTGGYTVQGASNSVETYDSASGTWAPLASMIYGRAFHAAAALSDGRVVVAGTGNQPSSVSEVYDPVANQWSAAGNLNITRSLPVAGLLPTGQALFAGGYSYTRPTYFDLASCELFDPATNTWAYTGPMTNPRYEQAMVVLANGQVLAAGGLSGISVILSTADIYSP